MANYSVRILAWLCAVMVICTASPVLVESESKQGVDYRLSEDVWPSHYELELTPYLDPEPQKVQFTFDGIVRIKVKPSKPNVREITLHANKLNITSQKLNEDVGGKVVGIIGTTANTNTQKFVIALNTTLEMSKDYLLEIRYVGEMSEDMAGFYRSSYMENGRIKWLGTTQFQQTSARRAFPSFDEPKFKAHFVLKINRMSNYVAISNTPLQGSVVISGRVQDTFKVTPKMSTYLLAFIVSEFKPRQTADKKFGVWARPDAYNQTQYSFDVGQKLLDKLSAHMGYDYYSVPEMTKMEMAALPDFSAGAMENWGLLTYRESSLLYDSEKSTSISQQRIASVIAHEQAHMWFGDLVTCDWWSYTWLNEGFARYYQYHGTAMVETTWDLPHQFVVEQCQGVFIMDSSEKTHPMTDEVNSPAEASAIFDNISYNKGACVMRMTEHLMGSDKFKLALQQYLKKHAFQTAKPADLFAALQQQTDPKYQIDRMIGPWTTQSGYPLVTVTVAADRRSATLRQKRFFMRDNNRTEATVWDIPITFVSKVEGAFSMTMPQTVLAAANTQGINVTLKEAKEWVIFNVQQTGYYRVNYDTKSWDLIVKGLAMPNHDGIHVLNRAQIVDDALNLARAGVLEYGRAMRIVDYLRKENNYLPWLAAFNGFGFVMNRMSTEQTNIFKPHLLGLMDNTYKMLGFEPKTNDTRLDIYNRVNICQWSCKYGHKECIASAKNEFDKLLKNPNHKISADIRPVVYCTAVREGGQDEWNVLWKRFESENVASEQVLILTSLGCTKNKELLNSYLNKIMSSAVRRQDKSSALTGTYTSNPENVQIVYDYMKANNKAIATALGGTANLATALAGIAGRFTTATQISDLKSFAMTADLGNSIMSVNNALADAEFNINWAKQNVPNIMDFVKNGATLVRTGFMMIVTLVAVLSPYLH